MLAAVAAAALYLTQLTHAAPQGGSPSSASSSSADASLTSVPAPTVTVSTAIASPTASLDATLPSQIPDPPVQSWCTSQIFCAGPLLQTINVAGLYADPKTFVDKPTSASAQTVLANFKNLTNSSSSLTESQLVNFVDSNFGGEGTELEGLPIPDFNPSPSFLRNVTDPLVRAWSGVVHGYWTQLIRGTNQSALCSEGDAGPKCESSLIPLNHTFVVPGGRFREQYYWDSYWIVQGLIKSELFDLVNATLQNFMDELETIGFIPNGGRIYYLNRSQPPLFINMLADYVSATNDTAILDRALPLAEKIVVLCLTITPDMHAHTHRQRELTWWQDNRTMNVTSPFTNQTYAVARYAAANTAPRPESYLTDYNTANDPSLPTLSESERSDLYAELASGAETGWDYTARFIAQPLAGGSNNTNPALRTLQVRSTIPICLNSILCALPLIWLAVHVLISISDRANTLLASLYDLRQNSTAASTHLETALHIRSAVLDLFWDADKLAFYDFNLTSHARNSILSAATFYPYWVGILPDDVLSDATHAFGAFASLNAVLRRYNGTYPTTFVESGLQWDAPNAWPPHQYILLDALRALPANISAAPLPAPPGSQSGFALVPAGQMGMDEGGGVGVGERARARAMVIPDTGGTASLL
ncbi:hypothetical protein EWM64_g5528 [Hericium alpestre]|uniref:Trehalase n=1 Tax=Hericium alpestre TaxID=135208 RepID=A0A4Y9ZUE1_9AGAM|nr:hypothetical protein EWM64_g5528 [Hericium alpestre]